MFLVPLTAGAPGVAAALLAAAAFLLAELWFHHYAAIYAVGGRVWLLLFRNLAFVACYAVLVWALVASPRSGGIRYERGALFSRSTRRRRPCSRVPAAAGGGCAGRAGGRALSRRDRASPPVDLPPFPASAMDGFALRAADTPADAVRRGRVAAGRPADRPLAPGEAMGIATGGVVPEGADAVVPIEDVADETYEVEVPAAGGRAQRPCRVGRDVERGGELVPAGSRLGAARIAALARRGRRDRRRARGARSVAVLDDRVPSCARRRHARSRATSTRRTAPCSLPSYATRARASRCSRRSPTTRTQHREAIEPGLEHDVLVTSGGVSVGPHDLVRAIEAELGVEEVFWGVAVKPGKPVSFGHRGDTLTFGLPGNPVSSFVTCELFVRPAVLALQGAADARATFEVGGSPADVRRNPRTRHAAPGADVDARRRRRGSSPSTGQESHMIARAAAADALVLVERGEGRPGRQGRRARYVRTA